MHYNLHMNKQPNTSKKQEACLVLTEQKLYLFSQTPLAQFSKQGLKGSSTGATVICAFLMGAAKTFASDNEALQLTISELLGLDDRGTMHLIDTTGRLGKKYPFIKEILRKGQQTAAAWLENDVHTDKTTLDQLLQKCQNLTLMDLKQMPATEEEPAPPTARIAVNQAVEGNPRLKRLLLILLALIILVTANYLILTLF